MLINLRNALMAGKRLPYDAEVEYLKSTGTQYINTGVYLSNNHSIEIDYQFTSANQRRTGLFGGLVNTGSSQGRYGGLLSPTNGYLEMGYGKGNVYYQIGVADLNRHTIVQDMSELYLDGSLIYTFPSSTFSMGATALLFNFRYANYTPAQCKIYRAKVWLNGVLIRDYIAVRKSGVGYLYDRVSGKLFGNAGTGDFVLGPDVVPVEYIESHGTEYIDTGYVGTDTSGFNVEIMPLVATDKYFFGSRPRLVSDDRWLAGLYGGPQVYIGWNTNTFSSWTLNAKHLVENNFLNSRKKVCDSVTVGQISTSLHTQNGRSAYIFSANDPSVSSIATCRIYAVKVSENTTLVRSFRSVRVGTDATSWEGAMMDVLTRRVYRNAGTGAFTYGNDLKYPIPAE